MQFYHQGHKKEKFVLLWQYIISFNPLNNFQMKSLIKKQKVKNNDNAQCCAKKSKIVAGCHD